MAGPGAFPENTVPATSSCCMRASASRSLPHTAMSALVSDGVHDMPRHTVKPLPTPLLLLLLEAEAEPPPAPSADMDTFRAGNLLGADESEWYWLPSLSSSDSGDGSSVFGVFSGADLSGERSALLGAAMFAAALLLRGGVVGRGNSAHAHQNNVWTILPRSFSSTMKISSKVSII